MLYFKQISEMDNIALYAQYVALEAAFAETISKYPKLVKKLAQFNDNKFHIPRELSAQMWFVNKQLKKNPLFNTIEITRIRKIEDVLVLSEAENLAQVIKF